VPAQIGDDLLGRSIQGWIDSCDKNHKSCAFRPFSRSSSGEHAIFLDSLPKRLIDVGEDGSSAHLIESENLYNKA
jgi:hypothetical protein